ncbi:MAG: ATP-binding cassette domain-containing protein [Clostridia bacterium]|nr:ATP-binding cassette domain-containing protein [Clostridia bacterium]
MIKVNSVCKTFKGQVPVEALKNVNLNVEAGEIHGIIGLSGAGKSTLLRMLNGLEVPDSGEVFFKDQNLKQWQIHKLRQRTGMIFQHFNLLSSRNVIDNVCLPLELTKVSKKDRYEKAEEMLALVGLSDKRNSAVSTLSGGQKQRVVIARALINTPEVLLCDEATSALDPITTNEILDLIQKLSKQLNLTVVLITHEMGVITKICHYVSVMDHGMIVEQGPVKEVFSNPKAIRTQGFIKAV